MRRIIIFIVVTLFVKFIFGIFTSNEFPYISESILIELVQWGASIMIGSVVAKMELSI